MSKELAKYCSISVYLEKTHPKLFGLLKDLCLVGQLNPRKFNNGLTFLIPTDKAIKVLMDMTEHANKIEDAVQNLRSYIIHDYIPSASEWQARAADLPLGIGKKIALESASGDTVTFKNKVKATKDKKYVPLENNNNTAVYRVTDGEMNHTDFKEDATYQHAKKGAPAPKKTGGFVTYYQGFDLELFVKKSLGEYVTNALGKRSQSTKAFDNNLLVDLVSFVQSYPEKSLEKYLTPCVVSSFVMIMSPDHNAGLTTKDEIKEWYYGKRFPVSQPVTEYIKLLSAAEEGDGNQDTSRTTLFTEIKKSAEEFAAAKDMNATLVAKMIYMNYIETEMLHSDEDHVRATKFAGVYCPITRNDFAQNIGSIYGVMEGKSVFDIYQNEKELLDTSVVAGLQRFFSDTSVSGLLYGHRDRLEKHYNNPSFQASADTVKWITHLVSKLTPEQQAQVVNFKTSS